MPLSDPHPTPHPTCAEPSPRRRRRAVAVAAGGLAVLLAAAPFVPDRGGRQPALAPSGERTAGTVPPVGSTARLGAVTPEMEAEIERVVSAGLAQGRVAPGASAYDKASALARCAEFEGQRYCLGVGWTHRTEEEVALGFAARRVVGRETTGDLDPAALLQRAARMAPARRARLERAELTAAARSVAKVWLLRHEIEGVPLPEEFSARHPEVTARAATGRYPEKFEILDARQARSQNTTYWCGPTAMQAFAWGWRDRRQDQQVWAERLRTTTAGTAITDMVRVINNNTGYDNPEHAGPYVVLDIGDYDFRQWWRLVKRHVHDYRAPIVLHPVLLKRYFPYLDDDASGHFQVGRGFDRGSAEGRPQIGYLEPWDQSKFDPSEPFIPRAQWRSAYKSFRANQAHFQHNIGV